jgi:hypothetical protein
MSQVRVGQVALSLVVLATCGGPPKRTQSPQFQEGTRLKAVYLEAEGAPPRFLNWYDTQLKVDCKFADVGLPDRMVCFPSDGPGSAGTLFFVNDEISSQSTCDAPLVPLPSCNMHFLARSPKRGEPCGTGVQLFSLLTGKAPDPASGSTPNPSCEGLHLGPEIPLESLVSGTYVPGTGPGRIVPLTIVASDGSVQTDGTTAWFMGGLGGEVYPQVMSQWVAWDTRRKEMVSASSRGPRDLADIWHPLVDSFAYRYADASCSVLAAVAPACPARVRSAFTWGPQDACWNSEPMDFVELGAPGPIGADEFYRDSTECILDPRDINSGRDPMAAAFPLGPPIPATEFAEATEVRTGARRLQLRQAGTADAPAGHPVGFFDAALGQPCEVRLSFNQAPDTLRCLPPYGSTFELGRASFFADAACSVPLVALYPPNACAPQPSFAERVEDVVLDDPARPPGCSPNQIRRRRIYRIGERFLGTIYSQSLGPCVVHDFDADAGDPAVPAPQPTLHLVGPEVPQEDFAAVKYVRPN